jgi:hypothetical protein
MTDEITVMFQEQDAHPNRRHGDKPGEHHAKARIVWDEVTRTTLFAGIAEAVAKTVESMGIDTHSHREQHRAMTALIPWMESQKRKADKQSEFWETLLKENVKRGIGWAFWLLVSAMVLGFSGAWDAVLHRIAAGG